MGGRFWFICRLVLVASGFRLHGFGFRILGLILTWMAGIGYIVGLWVDVTYKVK